MLIPEVNTGTKPLSNLSEILEKARADGGIPGMSVAVLYKGELIFSEGFGKRNDQDPFTPETLMPIASTTKMFTAAAIGELVAEGKMDWDTTPVSKYLPEFELQDPILTSQLTLVDLLSHRTGVPDLFMSWFRSTESRRDLIKRMKHFKVDRKLRAKSLYNNVMYAVAGEAAANVAGMPYEQLIETKIFQPLGLSSSGFWQVEMGKRPNHASRYDARSLEDAVKGDYIKADLERIYMADGPSSDMFSNVLDLVKWGQVIVKLGEFEGKQVLSKESMQEMLTGHSIKIPKRRTAEFPPAITYGLGLNLDGYKGRILYRHGGSVPGFRSNLAIYPDDELIIAHLCNINVTDLPDRLAFHIADEVLGLPKTQDWFEVAITNTRNSYESMASLAKGEIPKRIENRPPTHELDAYVGDYTDPIYGDASVELKKGDEPRQDHLVFKLKIYESKLVHVHVDSFSTVLESFGLDVGVLASFETDARDGTVAGLRIGSNDILPGAMAFKRKKDADDSNPKKE